MIRRNITTSLLEALSDSPVVFLNGARQTGKSTLVKSLAEREHPAAYYTLDDATTLAAAEGDPDGFIRSIGGPVVLDEVQRAPGLFLAIKAEVDRNRAPGRFLLTGSADVLLLPSVSEALAGRMEILTLWPFSQGELEGRTEHFVDAVFEDASPSMREADVDVLAGALRGGYPEAIARSAQRRRDAWFESYIMTILQRDVRDLANIEGLTALPRLLSLLAARTGSLLNYSEIPRASGLPQSTLKRYMTLLETTFLLQPLQAWSGNLSKRLVKSPKVMLNDAGLAAHLTGLTEDRIDREGIGPLLENFVYAELLKQVGWSRFRPALFHFRTGTGQEVDLVLERRDGRLVGIEVKAGQTLSGSSFKGLRALADAQPERFHQGIVLYTGRDVVGFGPNLHAAPVSSLWRWPG